MKRIFSAEGMRTLRVSWVLLALSIGAAVMMGVKCPGNEAAGKTPVEVFPKD